MSPGDTIGKYTIEADLGEGGMGRVYVAHDPVLDRKVALKVVRLADGESDEARRDANARLFREARAAAKLDHPNVVAVFDMGEVEGTPYLAMELVKGRTLREAASDPSVPVERRLGWLVDAARALAAAHRAGIVHRDVKPENVMVRDDGVVKVLDFGIARRARAAVDPNGPTASPALATVTRDGLSVGTPLYMTPEQISGDELDGRTDQFAWAVMAHEVLTGSVPWRTKNEALGLVAAILTQPAPSLRAKLPDLSPDIDAVFAKCLSKSPADRFASMDDVVVALQAASAPAAVSRASGVSGAVGGVTGVPPVAFQPSEASREVGSREASSRAGSSPNGALERPVDPGARISGAPSALDGASEGARGASAGRTTAQRRYSDDEIREIVARAAARQQGDDRLSHAELLDVAREMGLDERAVEAAARDLARERDPRRPEPPFVPAAPASAPVLAGDVPPSAPLDPHERARRARAFFRNLASFMAVNAFIFYFLHNPFWQRFLLFGWGLGLFFQLLGVIFPKDERRRQWERERWHQRAAEWGRREEERHARGRDRDRGRDRSPSREGDRAAEPAARARAPEPAARDRAIEEGVEEMLRATERRRLRVSTRDAAKVRVRADGAERDRAAEEEAAAAEEEGRRRGRS